MGCAEVISFGEVRATKQWATLRQQLHIRFDQWLDRKAAVQFDRRPRIEFIIVC
jgi:hypothetical protein